MTDYRILQVKQEAFSKLSASALESLVRENGLVAVQGPVFDITDYSSFVEQFGRSVEHPFLPSKHGPVSQLKRSADRVNAFIYGGAWHQNLMFLRDVPDITILYAHEMSDTANFTAFVDLSEVAPWLSSGLTKLLRGINAVHSTKAPASPQNALPDEVSIKPEQWTDQSAVHPGYVQDAGGRSWPYILSNYVTHFEHWHAEESKPIIEVLRNFAVNEEFVIRHYWDSAALLLWDNRRFLHRATITHRTGTRTMWRADRSLSWEFEDDSKI